MVKSKSSKRPSKYATILKTTRSSDPLYRSYCSPCPAKVSRVYANRSHGEIIGRWIMPATVFRADAAVVRRVLVPIDGFTPGAADEWRVKQEVYLLAVVEGLGV